MQKVLTAAQMREVDRLTTERYGIPSIILMENAAHAVARVITEKLGGSVKGKSILILCGKGNNGGDGAALARILHEQGARIEVNLFGKIEETRGDAKVNFERLAQIASTDFGSKGALYFEEVPTIDYWVHTTGTGIGDFDIAVDAIFGTGLKRPLDDLFRTAPEVWKKRCRSADLSTSDTTITLSVDIPTGLNSDEEVEPSIRFESDVTVTFTAPKRANILPPASRSNGELVLTDIGSPKELIDELPSHLYMAERADASAWLEKTAFSSDDYKNKRGHALLIAGSENYSGAAVLAGNAAMRSGVGLTTLACPANAKTEIASRLLPDVILKSIESNGPEDLVNGADAIAVGCGLDANDAGIEKLVRHIVDTREVPVIVDAGALWYFNPPDGILQKPARVGSPHVSKGSSNNESTATSPNWPPADAGGSALVLTPHEGEFLRLLGTDDKDAIKDRVAAVREFSQKNDVMLVLKGERVLIGEPGGKVVVNPTGNSGLGKAGNGDTLTGILAGFVAQAVKINIDIFETVVAAVYIAGMAGDVAEKKYGKRVMTASDVRECLADVFLQFQDEFVVRL